MNMIKSMASIPDNGNEVLILKAQRFKKHNRLTKDENDAVREHIELKKNLTHFRHGDRHVFVVPVYDVPGWECSEKLRKTGAKICAFLNESREKKIAISGFDNGSSLMLAEGLALSNYQFLKYLSDPAKKANTLKEIVLCGKFNSEDIHQLNTVVGSTFLARDLVNEPQNFLNAVQLSEEFKRIGKSAGFKVEVWNESRITSQKMGGLLAVNKGSKTPPTFNIMEYKPRGAQNNKPFVLVGKGVVYDTGGLSLKPTPNSMDMMKCDMAGSAVVAAVMNAVARLELPLWVVGLVPATDNWIGENSYAPGDVITMYNGTTVEILNTDAEGRLILADALHFASKLKPELVCDFATLTGAAVRAVGTYASAFMCKSDDKYRNEVFESSYAVFERLVEFPLWPEYGEELKSEIADMTNLGKGEAGQISAGKFLEHFTDYPWMHFDIAGPAFLSSSDGYRPKGGTGTGVRLMIDFLKKQTQNKPNRK